LLGSPTPAPPPLPPSLPISPRMYSALCPVYPPLLRPPPPWATGASGAGRARPEGPRLELRAQGARVPPPRGRLRQLRQGALRTLLGPVPVPAEAQEVRTPRLFSSNCGVCSAAIYTRISVDDTHGYLLPLILSLPLLLVAVFVRGQTAQHRPGDAGTAPAQALGAAAVPQRPVHPVPGARRGGARHRAVAR